MEGRTDKNTYNWKVLASYNDMMAKMVEECRRAAGPVARMELLNVFPKTILRATGWSHCGRIQRFGSTKDGGLHYSALGPVDFGNHLLFSQVKFI